MKQYVDKKCKIHVKRGNSDLFYTATVLDVTATHITFTDRYDDMFTFNLSEIIEISGIKGGSK